MLLLDFYPSTVDEETGPSGMYAVVHAPNDSGEALKLDGSTFGLEAYLSADHHEFAIPLLQHSQRSGYYRYQIDEADIDMPATGYGEEYIVEFWEMPGTGMYNADSTRNDILHEVRRIKWSGTELVDAYLPRSQVQHEVFVGASFAVATGTLKVTAWLERVGRIVTDPAQIALVIKDRDNNTIWSATNSAPDVNGIFQFQQTGVEFNADDSVKFTATITDADAKTYTSGGTLTIWD